MSGEPSAFDTARERTRAASDHLSQHVRELMAEVKPRLRGWQHGVAAPLALAAGVVLVVLSPTPATRVGSAVFAVTALLTFAVSGIYHLGTWSPRAWTTLRRLDHSNIFLLIAGTYTPFTLLLLEGVQQAVLLGVVWAGALMGVGFRFLWPHAPRWLYTPIYVALGWSAIFVIEDLAASASPAVMTLVVLGGLLYTLGGVVYALRRPNPVPGWFGFHEVFHLLTLAAFASHYTGVSLATYALR